MNWGKIKKTGIGLFAVSETPRNIEIGQGRNQLYLFLKEVIAHGDLNN